MRRVRQRKESGHDEENYREIEKVGGRRMKTRGKYVERQDEDGKT